MAQHLQTHTATVNAPGTYRSLFELGRGGMGTVFVAQALGEGGFQRLVVVKRLHPHLTERPDAVRRFLDEGRVAAHVRHANVAATLQVGNDESGYFLVLEYVEGASLENLLDYSALRRQPLDAPVVLRIALDVCAGLQAIHDAEDSAGRPLKILHRDLSLQNVLVGRDGVARITDFGVAKSAFASVSTDKSYVIGKLLYLPAEYLLRESSGPSLDVYSLGMTLWLTLSGQEPWPGVSEAQLVRHIVSGEVPLLSSVMRVAPRIEQVVAKACRRSKDERYQSAREMASDIEAAAGEGGGVATHAEVAACVEALAGAELRRRRELVAMLARADRGAPIGNSAPPPIDPAESAGEVVAAPGARRRFVALMLGAVVVAALLVARMLSKSGSRIPEAPASSTTPAVTVAGSTLAPSAPFDAAPTMLPARSSRVSASPVSQETAPPRPATSNRPAPAAPPAPERGRAPRVPDRISRKNPYRSP